MARSRLPLHIGTLTLLLMLVLAWADGPHGHLSLLEAQTLDQRLRWRGPQVPSPAVALVLINDATLARYGRWPLDRRLLAQALQRLDAAGARVIGLDMLLSEAQRPLPGQTVDDADSALATALAARDNRVLAYALTFNSHTNPTTQAPAFLFGQAIPRLAGDWATLLPKAQSALLPLETLANTGVALGHVSVLLQADAQARWDYPVLAFDGDIYPSLTLQMLARYWSVPISEFRLEQDTGLWLGTQQLLTAEQAAGYPVNYYGPSGQFPHYSLQDLLDGLVPAHALQGRIVLIGADVLGIKDLLPNAYTPVLPGVERHATLIDRLLQHTPLYHGVREWLWELGLVLSGGVVALVLALYSAPLWASISTLGVLFGLWGAAQWLLVSERIWLGLLYPSLSVLLVFTITQLVRLAMEQLRRRTAERALRASEQRYALAAAGANDGLWDYDLVSGQVYYSPRWRAMLGIDQLEPNLDSWLGRVLEPDRPALQAALEEHLQGRSEHFSHEYRMYHEDGEQHWFLARGLAVRDAQGQALRIAGSQTDISERKQLEAQLVHGALYDALTGLPNRALLEERLNQALQRRREFDKPACLLLLNLDQFSQINELHGHAMGDQVLIEVARRLEQLDTTLSLGRLGADTFAVLYALDVSHMPTQAQQLNQCLAHAWSYGGQTLSFRCSQGWASLEPALNASDILRDADLALRIAKRQQRGSWQGFDPQMQQQMRKRVTLESELRAAIAENTPIEAFYQPIIDLHQARVAGFEALVRWRHSDGKLVSPADFIPLAEETGLVVDLGRIMLERGTAALAQWYARSPWPMTIAVNVAGAQLEGEELEPLVTALLQQHQLAAGALKLEVTESMLMQHPQRIAERLQRLINLGTQVSLDDFGTGYSSLAYLHNFPCHTLKVDKSFVTAMQEGERALALVQGIVALAHALGRNVVAEGIETPQQAQQLRLLGVEYGQGYLFSRPLPAAEAALWVGKTLEVP